MVWSCPLTPLLRLVMHEHICQISAAISHSGKLVNSSKELQEVRPLILSRFVIATSTGNVTGSHLN